jgi:hypothetical protein
MRRTDWESLLALRNRRAAMAQRSAQQAEQVRREAADSSATAASAFEQDERARTQRQQTLYASIAGRTLSVPEMLRQMDAVEHIARESAWDLLRLQHLDNEHRKATHAAEQAFAIYRDRRVAAEKSDAVLQQITDKDRRREEIHAEVEMEEITVNLNAASGRNHRHA